MERIKYNTKRVCHLLGSFENSYIPENPRTPPISYISQTVIPFKKPTSEPSKTGFETKQKTVHICTKKKSLHICKVFGKKKKSFFRKNFFATGLIFERFLAPRSRFFEKWDSEDFTPVSTQISYQDQSHAVVYRPSFLIRQQVFDFEIQACHARIATLTAQLGLPELQLDVIPGFGGSRSGEKYFFGEKPESEEKTREFQAGGKNQSRSIPGWQRQEEQWPELRCLPGEITDSMAGTMAENHVRCCALVVVVCVGRKRGALLCARKEAGRRRAEPPARTVEADPMEKGSCKARRWMWSKVVVDGEADRR
ncbi:hypothetical protein LXL04_007653 [Taraxacum kok-saghyz]